MIVKHSLVGAAAVAVLTATTLAACTGGTSDGAQRTAARTFLTAFGSGSARPAAAATDNPSDATTAVQRSLDGLGRGARGHFDITRVSTKGTHATATYTARWTVPGARTPWNYGGSLALAKTHGRWLVAWRPTDLHRGLRRGEHLAVQLTEATRGRLLDSSGKALFAATPVVTVGVEPKLATHLNDLAATLARIPELQSTKAEIVAAVHKAGPTDFVPIITLRQTAYEKIRAEVHDLPGTVFQSATRLLGPSAHFGQPLLGTVDQATADVVAHSHGRIRAGQDTGVGGVQQADDAQLAGTPAVTVVAAPDTGDAAARRLDVVSAARPGTDVRLSLDRPLQSAAEAAIDPLDKPAAIVAVQRSTGRILVDANNARTTYDYGLSGAFPPGSTFKIATWAAAFTADPRLTPTSTVPCPASTTVDGRTFINENRFSHPPISVADAFGYSCNTSAIRAALTLPSATSLATTARSLGLGQKWSLPVSAFAGSIATPASTTERAADGIGQGRVLASPLLLALMASAADGGPVVAPTLSQTATPAVRGHVPAQLAAKMHTLMKATVALPGGTGHDLDGLGGVVGKTGTAEYGNAKPPRTHAWFAGVRGDIAFAVFVYDGATSHVDAVPVTRDFLRATR